jgi:hypothetical protein
MERQGILAYDENSNDAYDLFGERTKFRKLSSAMVHKIVSSGKWFGFCTRIDKRQVDIFSIVNANGDKLGTLVEKVVDNEEGYRSSLYRYLLQDYLCYCEIPTVVKSKDYNGYKDSYNKSLVTSNIGVIAEWLGISYDEAKFQYGSRFSVETAEGMCVYVKLITAKDGTKKVSKPRKALDLTQKGIRIVPLFALNAGLNELYKMASGDFYNVTFVKDSGQVRDITVCFDYGKLCTVYKDEGLLREAFEEQYKGDLKSIKSLDRGYIRVIEVGTNLRSHAVRSINLARVIGFERVEPDVTFINVDLGAVKSTFLNTLMNKKVNYKEISDMLEVFQVGTNRKYNGKEISSYYELESWVETQEMLLSTPFLKQLALFMMGNPQWFDGYTGEAISTKTDTELSDFEDDLDFDLL